MAVWRTGCEGATCAFLWACCMVAAAFLCARACCAIEQVLEAARETARKSAMITVRTNGSVRRIESTISVRRMRSDFECSGRYGFV